MKGKKWVLALLLAVPLAFAVFTTTEVRFNIEEVVAFTLTLPGGGTFTANSTQNPATAAIEFNTTQGTNSNVNPKVVGGEFQNSSQAIFQFDNIGTVSINLSVFLNDTLPTCIVLKGNTTFSGADTGFIIANGTQNASVTVVNNYGPNAAAQDWFMKSDFSGCTQGDSTTKTLTSEGIASS